MSSTPVTESQLLKLAAGGDSLAMERLVGLHRDRLKRMIRARLDPRLNQRLDESDVVQEVYIEAATRLKEYLSKQDTPFFNWLRFLARQKLSDVVRKNIHAQSRDVRRELPNGAQGLESSMVLSAFFIEKVDSPSSILSREEFRVALMNCIEKLPETDREVLQLRHVEQLSTLEASVELGITENTCRQRHVRALRRLKDTFAADGIKWD